MERRVGRGVAVALMACVLGVAAAGCAMYEHRYRDVGDAGSRRVGAWSVSLNTSFVDLRVAAVNASTDTGSGVLPVFDQFLQVDSLVVITGKPTVHIPLKPETIVYSWHFDREPPRGATSAWDRYAVAPLSPTRCAFVHEYATIRPREGDWPLWSYRGERGEFRLRPSCPLRPGSEPRDLGSDGEDVTTVEVGVVEADSLLAAWPRPSRGDLEITFPSFAAVKGEERRRFELHVRVIDRRAGEVLETKTLAWDQERYGHWYLWTGE